MIFIIVALFGFSLDLDLLGPNIDLLSGGLAGGSIIAASLLVIAIIGGGLDARHSIVTAVLLLLGLIPVTATIASTTTATTAATTSPTSATTSSVLEAVLLIVLASLLPVVLIAATGVVTATATASSSLARFSTLVELLRLGVVGLDLSLSDKLVLLVAVSSLAHDLEVVLLPLGRRVCLEELAGFLLIGECDKDGALEEALVCASKLDALNLAELGKEAFEVELSVGFLVTEALDINGGSLNLGLGGVQRLVRGLALDLLLALLARNVEELAVLESGNNGTVGLECSHALEGVESLDLDGLVLASTA